MYTVHIKKYIEISNFLLFGTLERDVFKLKSTIYWKTEILFYMFYFIFVERSEKQNDIFYVFYEMKGKKIILFLIVTLYTYLLNCAIQAYNAKKTIYDKIGVKIERNTAK